MVISKELPAIMVHNDVQVPGGESLPYKKTDSKCSDKMYVYIYSDPSKYIYVYITCQMSCTKNALKMYKSEIVLYSVSGHKSG